MIEPRVMQDAIYLAKLAEAVKRDGFGCWITPGEISAGLQKWSGLPHRFGPQATWTPEQAAIVAAEQNFQSPIDTPNV